MATPKNAPYKKAQRKAKKAVRNRGKVLHRSNVVVSNVTGLSGVSRTTRVLQGTRIGSFKPEELG